MHKSARLDYPLQGSAHISLVHKDAIPGLCHQAASIEHRASASSSSPSLAISTSRLGDHINLHNLSRCCAVIDLIHNQWQQQ
ncbi:hypothetical protein CF326_g2803 [Tilletia indica]|nr:hypothetical protein CF326_g2803 [Tilletia indica]